MASGLARMGRSSCLQLFSLPRGGQGYSHEGGGKRRGAGMSNDSAAQLFHLLFPFSPKISRLVRQRLLLLLCVGEEPSRDREGGDVQAHFGGD